MRELSKCGLAAIMACLLAVAAHAQSMTVSPSPILQAGDTAVISYSNPSLANQNVSIRVSGGFPSESVWVKIQLDANGDGVGDWAVGTKWLVVAFNAPGVNEIVRAVNP